MTLSPEQYHEIITEGLDHKLARLRGGIVFDDFDPAVAADISHRKSLEMFIKSGDSAQLKRMLQALIKDFEFNDDNDFASFLFQRTGYKILPVPQRYKVRSARRNIRIGSSGSGHQTLTYVSIELSTGSGAIYAIKGSHPELKADWLDEHTIEIRIPAIREERERVNQVKVYEETIQILYKEQ